MLNSIMRAVGTVSLALMLALPIPTMATGDKFDFNQLNEIIKTLRETYVDQSKLVSDEELFQIAVDAILEKIGDKHGHYFTKDEYDRFQREMRPSDYGGAAIEIVPYSDSYVTGLMILGLMTNSPLRAMNIHIGDVIIAAGQPNNMLLVTKTNIKEVVDTIKGEIGTDVTLRIKRNYGVIGDITVPRVKARRQFVYLSELTDDGILTVRISEFSSTVTKDLLKALDRRGYLIGSGGIATKTLDKTKVKSLVLDLRSDPGGSLRSALQIADMFLPFGKQIVAVDHSDDSQDQMFLATKYQLFDIPFVVLVNGSSASASEIVAGALQKHRVTYLLGEKTYGKGSVQQVNPIGSGGFKNTIARYYAGGDVVVDGIGLTPNMIIPQNPPPGTSELTKAINARIIQQSMSPEIDHQLHAAYVYLRPFLSGAVSLENLEALVPHMNTIHGVKTPIGIPECKKYGLLSCTATGGGAPPYAP